MPHMCHPVGMPQGFPHQYPYSGLHSGSFCCRHPAPPFQHPAPGSQKRIELLETQLARAQRENDSKDAVIKYLLADLGASTKTRQPCPDCSTLKFRLVVQSKAAQRWKGKYREAATSSLAKEAQLSHLHNTLATGTSTRLSQQSSSSGVDVLVGTDLLGGTIPIAIIERFPASSSFNTDPPSADSPPELGNSDDDQSSESEAESVDYAPSMNLSRLPVKPTQHIDRKLAVFGDTLTVNEDEDPSDFDVDPSSSKADLPYVRYFSGMTAPTGTLSDDVGGNKKHMGNLATLTSLTDAFIGPVSVLAGPRVSRALTSDDLSLSLSSEPTGRISPYKSTGSSFESNDQILSGGIRWAVGDGIHQWKKRLFLTEAERESAIAMNRKLAGREDVMFPDIFRYGIRYNPEPTAKNVYRTVLIEGLPGTVTLEKVLRRVRGGSVLSTKLCDTYSITGSCSALITFVSESAAYQYKTFAASQVIYISGTAVTVSLLNSPTWPMTIPLRRAIFDHHHTRCLEVTDFPRHIDLCALRLDLRVCSSMDCDMIEYLGLRDDEILEIRFSSINAAGQAFGLLTCRAKYRPCSVRFSPDPCGLLLNALLEQEESDSSVVVSDDSGIVDDDEPVDQFADDEGVGEGEKYAEEDEPHSIERFSPSWTEAAGEALMKSHAECFGDSLLD